MSEPITLTISDQEIGPGHMPGLRERLGTGDAQGQEFHVDISISGSWLYLQIGNRPYRALPLLTLIEQWANAAAQHPEAVTP